MVNAETGYYGYRQLSQKTAAYNPVGGNNEKACANCQFFVSPSGCTVVEGYPDPIAPTGVSNMWHERETAESTPVPVMIVERAKMNTITRTIKALTGVLPKPLRDVLDYYQKNGPVQTPAFGMSDGEVMFQKDVSGNWRWVAFMTNKFRDRSDPPEILEEAAHKDYVEWVNRTKSYPEAWLWHTPGTKWGTADWVDYDNGFVIVSGVVDKGMEAVASFLTSQKGLGVSHGFYCTYSDKERGIIGAYRSFELSILPIDAAANPWTGIEFETKEGNKMDGERRQFLVSALGEGTVKKIEDTGKSLAQDLAGKGVEFKEAAKKDGATSVAEKPAPTPSADEAAKPPAPPAPGAQPETPAGEKAKTAEIDYEKLATMTAKAMGETPVIKTLSDRIAAIERATGTIPGMEERLKALEKSDDEKIAAFHSPKVSAARKGFQASASETNKADDAVDATQKAAATDSPVHKGFLAPLFGDEPKIK